MKKILATDMDGTFLNSNHDFDKEAFGVLLEKFKEKGYLFVAASGRSLLSLEKVFSGFEDQIAFLAENGSVVSYKGQIIFEDAPIPKETYLSIIKAIDEGPYGASDLIVLSGRHGSYMLEDSPSEYYDMISQFYINIQKVASFADVTEDIAKLVAAFPEENMEEAQAWINHQFPNVKAVTTGVNSVDIILSGINKAIGLQKMCEFFEVNPKDVVAFGDNQNDIEMLEFAGLALATANAKEEVKAQADQVIGHCNEGAVLHFMEEYADRN